MSDNLNVKNEDKFPFFSVIFSRNFDKGFAIGLTPIWIHKHLAEGRYHLHLLFELGFWFVEFQVGKEI